LDADGWVVAGSKASSTTCAGVTIFGGFDLFAKGASITKSFKLPIHNSLLIKF
jgi:hypothetical protein